MASRTSERTTRGYSPDGRVWAGAAIALAILALAALPATGAATSLVPLTVEQMAEMADTVFVAQTESTDSRPVSRDGGPRLDAIETDVDLFVTQVLKGRGLDSRLTVAGGTIGDRRFEATWEPEFVGGETSILFLDSQGRLLGPQAKLVVEDGYVTELGMPATDVLASVLGREPLGPPIAAGADRFPASASLPLGAHASDAPVAPPLSASSFTMAEAATTYIDDGFEAGLDTGLWGIWDGEGSGNGSQWEIRSNRAAAGSYSIYIDDAAPTGGPYTNGIYTWLYAGPFDLSDATAAFLSYDVLLNTATGDYLSVTFSKGDETGDGFLDFNGFAYNSPVANTTFVNESIDLGNVDVTGDDFLGEPDVWVAFIFESDASSVAEGVYLDNILLTKNPDVPVISSISPGEGSAGTDTEVTITGTGFGPTQGTGTVEFTYDSLMGTTIEGNVTSWSDTEITCIIPIVENPLAYPGAAGTGPVTVTSGLGDTSPGYSFDVTFAYGGIKWTQPGMDYVLNANTSDTADEEALYDAAADTWSAASVFSFTDAGSSTATQYLSNGANEVFWTNTELSAGVLAAAGIWFTGDEIDEVDIGFNDTKLWGDGSGSSYDVQTIAVHELGHALNLRDLYGSGDSGKIMYGYGSGGSLKRDLDPDDVAGIQWIYPSDQLDLTMVATPDIALPGETITYTVTVENTAEWPLTSVEVSDTILGLISTTPTLAPGASATTTLTHSFPSVGAQIHDLSALGYALGTPTMSSTSYGVQVALPQIQVTVRPSKDPAELGSSITLRYRVRNTGLFPVTSVVVSDTVLGGPQAIPGTILPGAYSDHNEPITVDAPFTSDAWGEATYSSATTSDTAPQRVVSTYERIFGSDRVSTSVQASKRAYPNAGSAGTVVIASAYAWADALPASGLAGAAGGPLILTQPTSLPSTVRNEIIRLGATKAYIAGGEAAVSEGVYDAIDAIAGVSVERLGGSNRYETARRIADEMRTLPGVSPDVAFVATGLNFPDALAASSLAAAYPAPILLTDTDSLPSATRSALSALGPDTIVICGGDAVVSPTVESALGAYASGVIRRGGSDRYSTARLVVLWGESDLAPPGGVTGVYLSVGTNYPDALAGGVVAATANGSWNPLMLTPSDSLASQVSSYMTSRGSIEHVGVMGGESAVSAGVLTSAKALLP